VGNGRKAREIAGKWEQYSGRKLPEVFPKDSGQFPVISGWKMTGIHRKKSANFRPEYCFQVPGTSRVFLRNTVIFPHLFGVFLQYPVTGTIDLGSK
jgi:hypothetical protein